MHKSQVHKISLDEKNVYSYLLPNRFFKVATVLSDFAVLSPKVPTFFRNIGNNLQDIIYSFTYCTLYI